LENIYCNNISDAVCSEKLLEIVELIYPGLEKPQDLNGAKNLFISLLDIIENSN
jgi:hypothetical protein